MTYANSTETAVLLLVLGLVAFSFLRYLGYMRLDRMSGSGVDRRRNRALRAAVRPLGRQLREVRTLEQTWTIVREAAVVFGATGVSLRLTALSSSTPTSMSAEDQVAAAFAYGLDDATGGGPGVFRASFVVPGDRSAERMLDLCWRDGRVEIDRDTEIAVDIFCEFLGQTLEALHITPAVARDAAAAREPHT
jgi:hypothetical protein